MAHSFGIVVHGFDDSVIDSKIKVSEDSFLMTSEHPGKVPEGCEAALSRPPEPAFHVRCGPGVALVVPPSSEHLLAQVCSYDREGACEEMRTGTRLILCEATRVFQPEVHGSFQGFTARLGQGLGLHGAHLVNGLHEMERYQA